MGANAFASEKFFSLVGVRKLKPLMLVTTKNLWGVRFEMISGDRSILGLDTVSIGHRQRFDD